MPTPYLQSLSPNTQSQKSHFFPKRWSSLVLMFCPMGIVLPCQSTSSSSIGQSLSLLGTWQALLDFFNSIASSFPISRFVLNRFVGSWGGITLRQLVTFGHPLHVKLLMTSATPFYVTLVCVGLTQRSSRCYAWTFLPRDLATSYVRLMMMKCSWPSHLSLCREMVFTSSPKQMAVWCTPLRLASGVLEGMKSIFIPISVKAFVGTGL